MQLCLRSLAREAVGDGLQAWAAEPIISMLRPVDACNRAHNPPPAERARSRRPSSHASTATSFDTLPGAGPGSGESRRARAQAAGGGARAAEAAADALRLVDAYVKAFYLPWGEPLRHWLLTHPEYTAGQRTQLVACVAESQGLRRRERAAFLAQLESELMA